MGAFWVHFASSVRQLFHFIPNDLIIDLGINPGGGDVAVPENFLDDLKPNPGFHHPGGCAVAEGVKIDVVDAARPGNLLEPVERWCPGGSG